MSRTTPIISLIGRPNVGKSTLFNRLLSNSMKAITQNKPGVTRDRHYGIANFSDESECILIDTGGFYPDYTKADEGEMFSVMAEQARIAVLESDLVLVVADVRDGLTPFDKSIVDFTRREKKPFWVIANKYDSDNQIGTESEFYELGVDEVLLTSGEHARGIQDLKDRIDLFCKEEEFSGDLEKGVKPNFPIAGKIALIGAPNAGKSTLLNRLIGANRAVVSSVAGTTIDPIEGFLDFDFKQDAKHFDKNYFKARRNEISFREELDQWEEDEDFDLNEILSKEEESEELDCQDLEAVEESSNPEDNYRSVMIIDTAGIRRKSQISDKLESQSVFRSLRSITNSDVVVYMIDGDKGLSGQDKKLIGIAIEKGKSVIIAINKIDLNEEVFSKKKEKKEYLLDFKHELAWLKYCEPVFLSAKNGWGMERLKSEIINTLILRRRSIPTGALNRHMQELIENNPVMVKSGRGMVRFKVKYASMVKGSPPTFLLFANRSKGITPQYRRYLSNGLRKVFPFPNTPIHLVVRRGEEVGKK